MLARLYANLLTRGPLTPLHQAAMLRWCATEASADDASWVRARLASHPDATLDTLHTLAGVEDAVVRARVCSHPALPDRRELLARSDLRQLLATRVLSAAALDTLASLADLSPDPLLDLELLRLHAVLDEPRLLELGARLQHLDLDARLDPTGPTLRDELLHHLEREPRLVELFARAVTVAQFALLLVQGRRLSWDGQLGLVSRCIEAPLRHALEAISPDASRAAPAAAYLPQLRESCLPSLELALALTRAFRLDVRLSLQVLGVFEDAAEAGLVSGDDVARLRHQTGLADVEVRAELTRAATTSDPLELEHLAALAAAGRNRRLAALVATNPAAPAPLVASLVRDLDALTATQLLRSSADPELRTLLLSRFSHLATFEELSSAPDPEALLRELAEHLDPRKPQALRQLLATAMRLGPAAARIIIEATPLSLVEDVLEAEEAAGVLTDLLDEELTTPLAWETFHSLWGEFDGTLGELLGAVRGCLEP